MTSDSLSSNSYTIPFDRGFIDVLHDVGSQQMMDFPTRNDNTLDIFCTNRPFLLQRCVPIPGLSDHAVILVHTNILPARRKPTQRLVYLWKSANLEGMKEDICDFGHRFLAENSTSTPVDNLWTSFKQTSLQITKRHVPSNITYTRFSQSWSDRVIHRNERTTCL